ncbi:interaptin-like [Mytilus trossulus]|uniref:interaptin-like n=1 Tax=Mytilus trossulus TaxID=6551 RepID=UPI003005D637
MLIIYLLFFLTIHGFLLNNQQGNGGQTLPANQYMPLSTFFEEEKRLQQTMENLHHDTTTLRHDMDSSFALLTAQLQQKLDLLDTKLANIDKKNETNQDLEEKYKTLEQNYNNVRNELQRVTNKTNHLDKLLLVQTGLYYDALTNISIQASELAVLKNTVASLDKEILNLKQLSSIQPLREIKTLQNKVQIISAQTNSLSVQEHARSQDFLALYNLTTSSLNELTVHTNSKLNQLENEHNTSVRLMDHRMEFLMNETRMTQQSMDIQFSNIQKNQSDSINEISMRLQETDKRDNLKFSDLQKQMNDSTEPVFMTAHPTSGTSSPGILKFDNVKFSVGMSNLSSYKSTGKYICEKAGLYLISASIHTNTNNGYFYMYLNGKQVSNTMISYNNNNPSLMQFTGTVLLALQLRANDSMWVYSSANVQSGLWSTLTILKVK